MKKNDILIVVLLIVAVEGFLLWKRSRKSPDAPVGVPRVVETRPSNESPVTTTTMPGGSVVNSSSPMEQQNSEGETSKRREFKKIADPFCRTVSRGYIFLPSIFLKEFYQQSHSWFALPKSFANCLIENKPLQVFFSEYQGQYQIPWEPLVRMSGRITSIRTFAALSALEKEVDAKKYNVKTTRRSVGIFDSLRSAFAENASEPWQLIEISVQSLEPLPSYWPGPPDVHPVARFINAEDYKSLIRENSSGIVIIDARSKEAKKAYKISSPTLAFKANHSGSHRVLVDPSDFKKSKNKRLFEIDPSKEVVVLGRDRQDVNAFNAANFLSLAGYQKIAILKGGVEALGAPPYRREELSGPFVGPEELKNLRARNKSLVLIDCRNPGTARSTMSNALRIEFQDTNEGEDLNFDKLQKELLQRNPSEVVLFGSNGLDPKPNRVRAQLKIPGIKVSVLQGGFSAWQFFVKYKWSDIAKQRPQRMGSHLSIRKSGPASGKSPVRIDPKLTLGAPAGSVPPKRMENGDLQKAKSQGARIR